MLIEVFQVGTDTPIKHGVKSYPIQLKKDFNETLLQSCCVYYM